MTSPARLRPLRLEDAPAVLEGFLSSPDMDRQGGVATPEQARVYVERVIGEDQRATAVVDPADHLIGLIGLSIDQEERVGWFSYWMHAAHRGRGLTGRAAASVARWALDPHGADGLGLERLELGHRAENTASGAVARAAGFVHEGTQREKFLIVGRRQDVLTYGRLRSDPAPRTAELDWAPPVA